MIIPRMHPRTSLHALMLLLVLFVLSGCAELQMLREKNAQQEAKIQELRTQLSAKATQYDSLYKKREQEMNAFKTQVRNLGVELEKAKTQREEYEKRYLSQKDLLERDINELKYEKNRFEQLYQQAREKQEALQQQAQQAQADLDRLRISQAQGQASLGESRQQVANLRQEKIQLEALVSELREQLGETQADLQKAREQAAGSVETGKLVESLQEQLEDAETAIAKLKQASGINPEADQDLKDAFVLLKSSLKPIAETGEAAVTFDRRGVVVLLSANYLFRPQSVQLDSDVQPTLQQIASVLKRYPEKMVAVEGHTDSQQLDELPFADNWGLGAERAAKVVRYLVGEGGLEPSRVKSVSRSQYSPVADAQNVAANRRVEIILTPYP